MLAKADAGIFPSTVDVAALTKLIVGKLELLLELHGDALDAAQRQFIQGLYGSRPTLGPSCGTRLELPPPSAPLLDVGFPDPTAAIYGSMPTPTTLSRTFTVPGGGGVLSFRYAAYSDDGWGWPCGGGSAITLSDNTVGTAYEVVAPVCNSGGEKLVSFDLHPLAGHTLTFTASAWNDGYDGYALLQMAALQVLEAADASAASGGIVMCDRLAQDHVKQPAAMASVDACVGVATVLSPLSSRATLDTYLAASKRVVVKALEELPVVDPTVRRTALADRLALVQRWYDGAKGLYGGTDPKALLWKDASAVSGAFTRGAYSSALDAFCGSPGCASSDQGLSVDAAKLQSLLGSTLGADQEIFAAAFPSSGTPPLRGAPLAFVVANALHGASMRLAEVAPMHVVACLTKDCKANGITTEISQMLSLIGSVHDGAKLSAALAAAGLVRPTWQVALGGIAASHVTLVGALADAEGLSTSTPDLATVIAARVEAPPPGTSLPLVALSDVVVPSLRLASHYAARGTFAAEPGTLQAGLDRNNLAGLRQIVTGAEAQLTGRVSTYRTARSTLATTLVEELRNVREQQSIIDEANRKLAELRELANDLAAMRFSAASDRAQFASLAESYERLLRNYPSTSEYFVDPLPIAPVAVSAFDTRYKGSSPEPITSLSVHPPIAVEAGDLVRFTVSGTWSPTCAIQTAGRLGVPPFQYPVVFDGVAGAVAGPEGYSVTLSSGTFHAQSTALVQSTTDSACMGITGSINPLAGVTGAATSFSASSQTCSQTIQSTSDSDGSQVRLDAAFSQGLRLRNTPFPAAPAGSLLAVVMPRGEVDLGRVIDVVVLRPQLSFVIPTTADIYLVVNDLYGCGTVSGTLLVDGVKLHAMGARIRSMGLAMASALQKIRDSAAQHATERRLLPGTIAVLKDIAQQELGVECGCAPSTYPREIISFYDLWVDAVIADAERQVQAANVLREMGFIELDAGALASDLQRARYEGALLRLVPTWTLQGLDANELKTNAAALANATATALFPFIRIVYPETLDAVATDRYYNGTDARMQAILGLDWTRDFDVAADKLVDATVHLRADLDRTVQDVAPPTAFEVAVAFVRPGAVVDTVWHEADPERSATLWASIGSVGGLAPSPRVGTFRITPEDLYSATGGNSLLICSQAAPIVRTTAFYISRPEDTGCQTFNTWDRTVPTQFDDDPMRFPTKAGLESFRFDDAGGWLNSSVNVICGEHALARMHFLGSPGYLQAAGAGLSPFDEITADFSSFNTGFDYLDENALALVVWFHVEPRTITGGVRGVNTCP